MKIVERIANLIRDEGLTNGEIDYLMALLNDKKQEMAAAIRAQIGKRQRDGGDEFPSSHNLIGEVLKNR